jgi:hypothetical protein
VKAERSVPPLKEGTFRQFFSVGGFWGSHFAE